MTQLVNARPTPSRPANATRPGFDPRLGQSLRVFSGPSKPSGQQGVPGMPGPQFLRLVRAGLIVLALLSAVLCVMSLLAQQAAQTKVAAQVLYVQDLRDLRTNVSWAQSAALSSFLDPAGGGKADWNTYSGPATKAVATSLVAAAQSAASTGDLIDIEMALFAWQDALAVAHDAGLAPGADPAGLAAVTKASATLLLRLDLATNAASPAIPDNGWIALSLVVTSLCVVGFVAASVALARRTHRVLNIGLTIGLLAAIVTIIIVGSYASESANIRLSDSEMAAWSQTQTATWDLRTACAMTVMDPNAPAPSTAIVVSGITGGVPPNVNTLGTALSNHIASILGADNQAARIALVLNADPWQKLADAIGRIIQADRDERGQLVVSATWYVILLAAMCLSSIIATMGGIHARAKEYL